MADRSTAERSGPARSVLVALLAVAVLGAAASGAQRAEGSTSRTAIPAGDSACQQDQKRSAYGACFGESRDQDGKDARDEDRGDDYRDHDGEADRDDDGDGVRDKRGTIRIVQRTAPAASGQAFRFHASHTKRADSDFELQDGKSRELRVKAGRYTVEGLPAAGWTLDGITCDDTDSTVAGRTATIVVARGETVECTFRQVADQRTLPTPTPTPTPTPGPGPSQPGGQPVVAVAGASAAAVPSQAIGPATAVRRTPTRRGSALLRIRSSCATRRMTVRLDGRQVAAIAISVNGRRVRTVRVRNGARSVSVSLPTGPAARTRVRVRVTFTDATRPRTLTALLRRCAPAQVQPRFAG